MTVTKMRDSNKRRSQCGFCLVVGHRMTGCQTLKDLNAQVLGAKRDTIDKFMSGLGNPTVHKVKKNGTEEKQLLQEWMTSVSLIPKQTKHMHIIRCFYSAIEVASHSQNVLEVKLLHEGGLPMLGYSPSYFSVEAIKHWISSKAKSNHVLTSLLAADPQTALNLYTYSPN